MSECTYVRRYVCTYVRMCVCTYVRMYVRMYACIMAFGQTNHEELDFYMCFLWVFQHGNKHLLMPESDSARTHVYIRTFGCTIGLMEASSVRHKWLNMICTTLWHCMSTRPSTCKHTSPYACSNSYGHSQMNCCMHVGMYACMYTALYTRSATGMVHTICRHLYLPIRQPPWGLQRL